MVRVLITITFLLHLVSGRSKIDFPSFPYEPNCDCKVITECNQLNELAIAEKWNALKNDFIHCGFDRKVPKYCCPAE